MTQDNARTDMLPFLLEIGSEEIPARFIPGAMRDLEKKLRTGLEENHLACEGLRVVATPRRMAVLIDALEARQADREIEVKGPPVSVAFDPDGNPTKAGEGFARKAGIALADCRREKDKRGEYLVATKLETGRPAAEVLTELLPTVILGVPFRKVMRWGNHDLEYPRPLQWLVALLGGDVVPVTVDYLVAGRMSRGHRTLSEDRAIELSDPSEYLEALQAAGVVVDHDKRKRLITEGLIRELDTVGGHLVEDEELLTEVVFLCEHPTPFLGSYDEDFSDLPDQVVTTALKAHQRYFSVGLPDGSGLMNRFAAVRDGGNDHLDGVRGGNERVLRARLADAHFYWEFDQKKTPDENRAMLGSVTWLEGFGTVLDKTGRLERLASWLWSHGLGSGENSAPADLVRAAAICKSDLVSEMIKDGKEFTKLEGFIGARYAELAGEGPGVCLAMERHHYPRSASGELPGDELSSVLAVADRLDNVAGCWLAGFVPTGAKDPYALRRQVLAVLRILLDRGARLDLQEALDFALEGFAEVADKARLEEARAGLGEFVMTRLAGFFAEVRGRDPEVLRAVLPVRWMDPTDAMAWAEALEGYRDKPDFQMLATGFKRCRNILEGGVLPVQELAACRTRWSDGAQDFSGLPDPAEQDLLKQVTTAVPGLLAAEKGGEYDQVFALFSGLGPAIDTFFDQVRVNVDDEALKSLRHGFLREIHGLFAGFADFSAVAPLDKSLTPKGFLNKNGLT
jgi:glycyl-tRNA synthetase beta chain